MAEFTASPDDLVDASALTSRDDQLLSSAARLVRAAADQASGGVGPSHPALGRVASEVLHAQVVEVDALGSAARILSHGFAGAAEDYRDAEVRALTMLRGGAP